MKVKTSIAVDKGLLHEQPVIVAEPFKEVRRIVREVLGEQKATIILFGSWARGEATSISDIDLAIESPVPLKPGTLAELREQLEESHVPYRVDLVELRDADPAFRRRILEGGITWND